MFWTFQPCPAWHETVWAWLTGSAGSSARHTTIFSYLHFCKKNSTHEVMNHIKLLPSNSFKNTLVLDQHRDTHRKTSSKIQNPIWWKIMKKSNPPEKTNYLNMYQFNYRQSHWMVERIYTSLLNLVKLVVKLPLYKNTPTTGYRKHHWQAHHIQQIDKY